MQLRFGRRRLYLSVQNVTDELKQKQAITDSLIQKIIYSKRLLVDHVDALEQCMRHIQITSPGRPRQADVLDGKAPTSGGGCAGDSGIAAQIGQDLFSARNTCILLGATILEHIVTPKWLRLTILPSLLLTGGFSTLYVVKNVFVFRNKIVERELDRLVRTIDEFGNCIRRNMTYFNEIIIMKQNELIESRQIERAWDCITAAKEVTEILYDATRKLENEYALPARFSQYYSPMEELRDCEYFKTNVTDYSPKHIKDFHNIFAYVQSQYLLRLALTIATRPSISQLNVDLVKLDCLIRQLVHEEENHFKNLALELNKKKQLEIDELIAEKAMKNRSGPVAVLQDSSLKLSARMVAVAGECQGLDITLQRLTATEAEHRDNAKHLVEVANNMRSIESALSVCFDDFQRLMLVYNKFLNSKIENADLATTVANPKTPSDEEFPESFLRVEISRSGDAVERKDDFYAYMFDEQQAQQGECAAHEDLRSGRDSQILNFEKRITKGKFRPVLKQLRHRIDPIREEMLQKERRVLAAKGINVDQLFAEAESTVDDNRHTTSSTASTEDEDRKESDADSEGSAEVESRRRSKKLKERDNFAEMRNFLAQKQAINLFNLNADTVATSPTAGKEDVLESEC